MGVPPVERKDAAQPQLSQRDAFLGSASNAGRLLQVLGYLEIRMPEFSTFVNSFGDNGTIVFSGTERYESDMLRANAVSRPFGIEVNTLSDNIQLVLYPRMIFQPDAWAEETAKEMEVEVRRSGPQAMVYPLDGITAEVDNDENNAANILFMGHLVDALLTERYPIEKDAQSPEFLGTLRRGFAEVRTFIEKLSLEQRAKLAPRIARIGTMDDRQLAEHAWRYATYRVEEMKQHGLIASEGELYIQPDAPGRTPKEAIAAQKEYLRLSDRDLQERPQANDTPSPPWREYGTNRYNRSHQLFGRYEHPDTGLVVDFRLDTTHMPAKYGFFDTVEVATRDQAGGIGEHVILGQEVDPEQEAVLFMAMFVDPQGIMDSLENSTVVFPIVVAGDFPFQNPVLRPHLDGLVNDPGTKQEVARVLKDTMILAAEGNLQRVSANDL